MIVCTAYRSGGIDVDGYFLKSEYVLNAGDLPKEGSFYVDKVYQKRLVESRVGTDSICHNLLHGTYTDCKYYFVNVRIA